MASANQIICKYCNSKKLIKKGFHYNKFRKNQKLLCKRCGKHQQVHYTYRRYQKSKDKLLLALNASSVSVNNMARIIECKPQSILRRMKYLSDLIKRPLIHERNQVYEIDEMQVFVGNKRPEGPNNKYYIIYALNKRTKEVVDVVVGKRTSENINLLVQKLKMLSPKSIRTDGYIAYPKLIDPVKHNISNYNYTIERCHLTIREHLKRANRSTISYSKSLEMLEASVRLYFFWNQWQMRRF